MTVQEAIDRNGFGRFQRRLLLICGITWAADAAELLAMGFAPSSGPCRRSPLPSRR